MLISYHYNDNAIDGCPVQNRQAAALTKERKQLHQQFEKAGVAPSTQI